MVSVNSHPVWSLGKFFPNLPSAPEPVQLPPTGDGVVRWADPADVCPTDEPSSVRQAFSAFLSDRLFLGDDIGLHVRPPWHMWSCYRDVKQHSAAEWHADHSIQTHMVVWANVEGTEILFPNGATYKVPDYEVIVFDNQTLLHRSPPVFDPGHPRWARRWFARAYLWGSDEVLAGTPLDVGTTV